MGRYDLGINREKSVYKCLPDRRHYVDTYQKVPLLRFLRVIARVMPLVELDILYFKILCNCNQFEKTLPFHHFDIGPNTDFQLLTLKVINYENPLGLETEFLLNHYVGIRNFFTFTLMLDSNYIP